MTRPAVDLTPCTGATIDTLSDAKLDAYRVELERRHPGSSLLRLANEELLLGIGAAVHRGRKLVPTLAGVLFFGHEPQKWYPSFTITFLHFPGVSTAQADPTTSLYLDNREFRGTMPEIIDTARATIYEKISKKGIVEGFVRQDVPEYPEFAYREAVVNAVAHRNYGLDGRFIQVRLFADRIEVQSPGGLGGELTVDNIVYEQYTRNPHIMRLLEDYGYVERRGLGIDQMIRSMTEAGHAHPAFENRKTSFWVTLKGTFQSRPSRDLARMGLNDRQIRAIALLRTRGRLTNRDYQEAFKVAERTALYDLKGLVKAGLALPVSSGRGRYYILRD